MGEELEVAGPLGIAGPVNLATIVAAVGSIGEGVEAAEKPETRLARQESWLVPRLPTEEERELLSSLPDIIGTGALPEEPRTLNQDEIDRIALELIKIREAQDLLKGRHVAIRNSVFEALNFEHQDAENPSVEPGEFVSWEHGYKISRTISGGKPKLDPKAVEEEFPDDLKRRFMTKIETTTIVKTTTPKGEVDSKKDTSVRWVIDEDSFVRLVESGDISLSLLQKVITRTSVTASFTPGPLPKNARPS